MKLTKNTDELLATAKEVFHLTVTSVSWEVWQNYNRIEKQESFRVKAISVGIIDKTDDMGFIITKCLSLSGYGT